MSRVLPACLLLLTSACGVPIGAEYEPVGRRVERPLCGAEIAISGRLENTPPKPTDCGHLGLEPCHELSCWPVGTWRFRAEYKDESSTCPNLPTLDPEYTFEVTRDANEIERYTFGSTTEFTFVRGKVTSGGGGLCEGSIELTSPDGFGFLNLKPALQLGGEIDGFGEYDIFDIDQR